MFCCSSHALRFGLVRVEPSARSDEVKVNTSHRKKGVGLLDSSIVC